MKIVGWLFLFWCCLQTMETAQLREAYKTAANSEKEAATFIELTQHVDSSPVQQAYLGAAFALKAKFRGKKIKNLKTAKKLLEEAVSNKPDNIEIRMIRLSIQESLPKIAGYNAAISADKEFIMANLKEIQNEKFKEYLQGFIARSKSFSTEEKSLLLRL